MACRYVLPRRRSFEIEHGEPFGREPAARLCDQGRAEIGEPVVGAAGIEARENRARRAARTGADLEHLDAACRRQSGRGQRSHRLVGGAIGGRVAIDARGVAIGEQQRHRIGLAAQHIRQRRAAAAEQCTLGPLRQARSLRNCGQSRQVLPQTLVTSGNLSLGHARQRFACVGTGGRIEHGFEDRSIAEAFAQ